MKPNSFAAFCTLALFLTSLAFQSFANAQTPGGGGSGVPPGAGSGAGIPGGGAPPGAGSAGGYPGGAGGPYGGGPAGGSSYKWASDATTKALERFQGVVCLTYEVRIGGVQIYAESAPAILMAKGTKSYGYGNGSVPATGTGGGGMGGMGGGMGGMGGGMGNMITYTAVIACQASVFQFLSTDQKRLLELMEKDPQSTTHHISVSEIQILQDLVEGEVPKIVFAETKLARESVAGLDVELHEDLSFIFFENAFSPGLAGDPLNMAVSRSKDSESLVLFMVDENRSPKVVEGRELARADAQTLRTWNGACVMGSSGFVGFLSSDAMKTSDDNSSGDAASKLDLSKLFKTRSEFVKTRGDILQSYAAVLAKRKQDEMNARRIQDEMNDPFGGNPVAGNPVASDDPFGNPPSNGQKHKSAQRTPADPNAMDGSKNNSNKPTKGSTGLPAGSVAEKVQMDEMLVAALTKVKRSENAKDKEEALKALRDILTAQFDAQIAVRQAEISELRDRIDQLEKSESTKIQQRDAIIEKRLESLTGG